MPFAVVEKIGMGRAQQAAVKRNEGVIARLQRAAGQEHRKLDFTALDLPVIDELRTGRRPDNYGRGVLLGRREGVGGARLVVIPDEADEPDRRRPGTISRKSSSRLAARSVCCIDRPVTLPPGRARLATRPVPTGSPAAAKTIGMTDVACMAATITAVADVTMT